MPDQRPHGPVNETRVDIPDIAIHEAQDIPGEMMDRFPQVLALAGPLAVEGQDIRRKNDLRSRIRRQSAGAIRGAGVDDDHLIEERMLF